MSDDENTIEGTVGAQGEVGGSLDATPKPKPGALVEDESLCGLQSGGVAAKAPSGQSTIEGTTDVREEPSS